MAQLSWAWYFFHFSLVGASIGLIWTVFEGDGDAVHASLAFGGIAFSASFCGISWLGDAFKKVGLKGKDISKKNKPELPETMGAVCAIVYLFCMILFLPFAFYEYFISTTSGGGNRDVAVELMEVETGRLLHRFPHDKLGEYLSAILSLQFMVLLGIGDDLFDIRWRHKLLLPAIASIPMLMVYYVDFGVTQVVVPTPLQPYLGQLVNLGWGYYVYMAAVAIFFPNSINILAGVNGIEVGQSVIIALMIILNDLLYIRIPSHPATHSHLFSLYFLLPFLGVSLALLHHNWFPSKVFVGDTYCYFAGMVFAVVGILGHFSKTLLLLFIPQIFNFLYSSPQLFRIIPCPRHRLPHFNAQTGLLEPSRTQFSKPPPFILQVGLKTLEKLGLIQLWTNAEGIPVEASNLTILNLWLVIWGPMREDKLTIGIMALQLFSGLAGLLVRHKLALLVFSQDNLPMPLAS
ncbi:glycosyl transferase family 4-domain-containing protein [Peziza echinospora]|nr:glycosyl transferase family 4-domain-containing protein [Peziza echinospora]